MPVRPAPCKIVIWEGASPTLLAYVEDKDGDALVQAGCGSIAYAIYDLADPEEAVASGTLTIANVIYDTPQTDLGWPYTPGYNFRWTVSAASILGAAMTFRVEVTITAADASKIILDPWDIETLEIYSQP